MKRTPVILLVIVLVLVLGIWMVRRSMPEPASHGTHEANATHTIPPGLQPAQPVPLLGETILRGYGDTNLPPQNDLKLMSRLMDNSLLLLKSAANRPLSANEDWADLFQGRNAARERFISAGHVALNAQGQLVDRWQSPLFFHALGNGRFEIRSAGPDKILWTDDDIHRNADGSFRRGKSLDAPSLLEEATRERPPSIAP